MLKTLWGSGNNVHLKRDKHLLSVSCVLNNI